MKLNKTFGRIATTLVATAMLASMAVVPASAASNMDDGTLTNEDGITTVTFTKEYSMPANVAIPNITFTFAARTPSSVDEDKVNNNNTPDDFEDDNFVEVSAGVGTITFDDATLEPSDFSDDPTYNSDRTVKTYSKDVTMTLPNVSAFVNGPGVYKYEITETASVQDTDLQLADTHDLYVFVETNDAGKLTITGVEFSDVNDTKTNIWKNYYKLDADPDDPNNPDPKPTANELTINKVVTGDMGNRSQKFGFTVTIAGEGTEKYTINYIQSNGTVINKAADFIFADGKWTADIELADGEYARVYGLSKDDVYNVSEDDYSDDGYVVTYNNDTNNNAADGADGKFGEINATVTTTNNREAVSPTGLVMDIAPYALLVVAAAAGCFVFLRKRRED